MKTLYFAVTIAISVLALNVSVFAGEEIQLTNNPGGHILTNVNVWSPDSQWIVYDVRPDENGAVFEGSTIERVNVQTKEVQVLYEAKNGAYCGVVTYSPVDEQGVFIHGPENPTEEWQYAGNHRRGVLVETARPMEGVNLDARDLTAPFTPGALRGGTHVHVFSGDGQWVSFTYQDAVLAKFTEPGPDHDMDLRNVGVSVPVKAVTVEKDHERNHDGATFTVLVTKTTATPEPGSDDIMRAFSDSWVGTDGYLKADGTRQKKAIAFQGHVLDAAGNKHAEVYIVDLPDDVTVPGECPLEGTENRAPCPPKGTVQRRLTNTLDRKYPGLQGPRHWLRSSPDGAQIAFLMKDDNGIAQIWTVSPNGGNPGQVTNHPEEITTPFTWSPDGQYLTYGIGNGVYVTEVNTGQTTLVTPADAQYAVGWPGVIFSPDGKYITYLRRVPHESGEAYNQIFVVTVEE